LKFLEISRNLSNGLPLIRHTFRRTNALTIVRKGEKLMQFALLIYHSPEEFGMRKNDYSDPHLGAWRAYYKALVEAGVYVGANALEVPETGTTVRLRGKAPSARRPICRYQGAIGRIHYPGTSFH
jgi:hypothetical protein